MTREDLSLMTFFTFVPPLALVLFALAIVAITLLPQGRREGYVVIAAVLGTSMIVGTFITAWMWGVGFEFADAYKPVPPAVDRSMVIGFFVACASYAGFLMTGLLANIRRRRSR